MKLGFTTLLATALAALLLVPSAGAGPGGNGQGNGGGNGKGNGPPAWAGGGGGGGKPDGAGKPEWAGKPEAKPDKPGRPAAPEADDDDAPADLNPAQVCKRERDQMGAEAFAEEYGENENKANAFGMCVSREAHDRDGVTPEEEEPPTEPTEGDETAPAEDEPTDEDGSAEGGEEATGVQALLRYLWPVLYA